MTVPTDISALSTTRDSNVSPVASDNVFPELDDHIRALQSFVASVFQNTATNGWVTPYIAIAGTPVTTVSASDFWSTEKVRVNSRLFVGNGVTVTGTNVANQGTFMPADTDGANWMLRDSQFLSIGQQGLIGITGFARSEDLAAGANTVTIGVSGGVIGNKASRTVRAIYADFQHEVGTAAYGFEGAFKNKGSVSNTNTAYAWSGSEYTLGMHLVAGGDETYGGANVNPISACLNITTGGGTNATFNTGIRIQSNAITGTNGYTGTGRAIAMAKGHAIEWGAGNVNHGATIRSDVSDVASVDVALIFSNSKVSLNGTGDAPIAQFVSQAGTPVNWLEFINRGTGTPPRIIARGSDTDINIEAVPKGAGWFMAGEQLQFGVRTALGAETVTGYITIKDHAGNTRKLAVVS